MGDRVWNLPTVVDAGGEHQLSEQAAVIWAMYGPSGLSYGEFGEKPKAAHNLDEIYELRGEGVACGVPEVLMQDPHFMLTFANSLKSALKLA